MKKLWDKGTPLAKEIELFTVGDDPQLDQQLVLYDCLGSIAHAKMLSTIGILTIDEFKALKTCLVSIIQLDQNKQFCIVASYEDVHTAIEKYLTSNLGELGKKIHTARSRNDQVMLDIRLYTRDHLLTLMEELLNLIASFLTFAEKHKKTPMAGRTHFQKAMPSSFGLWAGAFAESLLDDMHLLIASYELTNQSPLGSAAGYGVALPIDRQLVADLLGFAKVQNNVLYVSNSRGKYESIALHAAAQIMNDLSKAAVDLIIFSTPEFGYVSIPDELCTGSSLMPHKKNPDGLELVRAKTATLMSYLFQTLEIIRGLPSGYNRDFQETKRPLLSGLHLTHEALVVMRLTLDKLQVDTQKCLDAFSPDLFATDYALELVQKGMPFRDAYTHVAATLSTIPLRDPQTDITHKKHLGAAGNLGLHLSLKAHAEYNRWLMNEQAIIKNALYNLA